MSGAVSETSMIVLRHLARRLEAALPPESVLSTIVETIGVALNMREVSIWLRRVDTDDYELAARYPEEEGQPSSDLNRPWPSATTDSAVIRLGYLNLPLDYQGDPIGELTIVPDGDVAALGPDVRQVLSDIARRAGPPANVVRMMYDLRRARERLVLAREEERRRLRRDLHDTIGPTLAALNLRTGTLRRLIHTDPDKAEAEMDVLRDQLRSVITDIRRVVYNLRPPALDELGMLTAIREHALQYQQDGLAVTFDLPDRLPPLPAAIELAAYRIVLEALTNVSRHAQATVAHVRLKVGDVLEIQVTDDGRGLPADTRVGVGLSSMRERAGELGGTCSFEPGPGGGTRITAMLPFTRQRDDERTPTRPFISPER
jgi:signal transduction histidine kinase